MQNPNLPTDFAEFDWDLAVFTHRRHLLHLEAWKSICSRKTNKLLHRQGRLWQEEHFGHVIRDKQQLATDRLYIRNNPAHLQPGHFRLSCGCLQ